MIYATAAWAVVVVAVAGIYLWERRQVFRAHRARIAARLAVFDAFVEHDTREMERLIRERVLEPKAQALGLPTPRIVIGRKATPSSSRPPSH